MLFYICKMPSAFEINTDKIEDIVMERYKSYSLKSLEYDTPTTYDILGHFMMCLIGSKSHHLKKVIVDGETKIFFKTLKMLKITEIKKELFNAASFLNEIDQIGYIPSENNKFKKIILNILAIFHSEAKHIFHIDHKRDCQKFKIVLPFTFLLSKVAKREIEISKGKISLPCGQWDLIIEKICQYMLEIEINFFKKFKLLQYFLYEMEDERLRKIIITCANNMIGKMMKSNKKLTADDIDKEAQYFPPCMANLHQILRQTHRLSYHSRYQYTLFLKDIGMPVKENVLFWKNEYMKPSQSSTCQHSWENKVSRYEYQIYHLYGLIGSYQTKTSHSCSKFIYNPTLKMDGGCPFAHLSAEALLSYLPGALFQEEIEEIIKTEKKNKPQRICARYLRCLRNMLMRQNYSANENTSVTEIISPLHYYRLTRGTTL